MSAQPMTDEQAMASPVCGARNRSGKPCGLPSGWGTDHAGFGRCKLHGGNTPNHRTHHLRVVEAMVPDALAQLQRQLTAGLVAASDIPEHVRLRAVQDVLDRMGIGAKLPDVSVSVSVTIEDRKAALVERAKALRAGRVIETTVAESNSHTNGNGQGA